MTESPPESGATAAPGRIARIWKRVYEHKVLQWALAYLGAALALAHGTELLSANFHWPELIGRLVIGLLIVGFPVGLAFAWYHGHKGLAGVGKGEMMIVSLLVVIGAGVLVLFVRVPEQADGGAHPDRAGQSSGANLAVPDASVAVLPFKDISPARDQEYFADGITEEVLNSLAAVPDLKVTGRTSSFYFKGRDEDLRTIGQTLGVANVLEGSVRKVGNQLRITAQLNDARTGYHRWSRTYERPLDDIFKIQEDIASSVAQSLEVTLGVGAMHVPGMTHNIDAYDASLAGRALMGKFSRDSMLRGIDQYQRAIALDPFYAVAWRDLATVYRSLAPELVPSESPQVWRDKADAAIEQVRRLAPNAYYLQTLLGDRSVDAGQWLTAARYYRSAAAAEKQQGTYGSPPEGVDGLAAGFLLEVGRFKDAIVLLERDRAVDPLNVGTALTLADAYAYSEDFSASFAEWERGQRLAPENFFFPASILITALATRDLSKIERSLDSAIGPHPAAGDVSAEMKPLLDRPDQALTVLHQRARENARNYFVLTVVAQWMAYFGDPQGALDIVRSQFVRAAPVDATLTIAWRPVMREVRKQPGFKQYLRDMGLVDYWREFGWPDLCHPIGRDDFECN